MGEDLHAHIWRRNSHFSSQQLLAAASQLLQAVAHMHHNRFIHRDIKPANLLLRPDGSIVLCDFGLARTLPRRGVDDRNRKGDDAVGRRKETGMSGGVCTLLYRPLELLLPKRIENDNIDDDDLVCYGEEIDVWSAGCVLAEMILLRPLFGEYYDDNDDGGEMSSPSELAVVMKIIDVLGRDSMTEADWSSVVNGSGSNHRRRFVEFQYPPHQSKLKEILLSSYPEQVSSLVETLATKLLRIDPDSRSKASILAAEASVSADITIENPSLPRFYKYGRRITTGDDNNNDDNEDDDDDDDWDEEAFQSFYKKRKLFGSDKLRGDLFLGD